MANARLKIGSVEAEDTAFESLVGYNLKRAYLIVQADYHRAMETTGLSPRVFAALSFVVAVPGLTQSDLARRLGIERSGLVSIVDRLEAFGYLNRTAVPGDRRVQALEPTDAGITAYDDAIARAQAHEADLLGILSAGEKRTLLALLGKIRSRGETE
jgi:DNA-binding MarR family transcriptional regulator